MDNCCVEAPCSSLENKFGEASSTRGVGQSGNPNTSAAQVNDELREELQYKVYADTEDFLEKIFDLAVPTDDIWKNVIKKKGLYRHHVWTDLPTSPTTEKELYEPFTKIANSIADYLHLNTETNGLGLCWITDPHRGPEANDPTAASGQPDIVAVREGKDLGKQIDTAKQRRRKTQTQAQEDTPKPAWRDILVPVEVKKHKATRPALRQLCKYIRNIFRESIDRRFVLGLVLSNRHLTVWLGDRSGMLGSKAFNIHEDPKLFVKIIAAFSNYPTYRLGLDQNIERYVHDVHDAIGTGQPRMTVDDAEDVEWGDLDAESDIGSTEVGNIHPNEWRVEDGESDDEQIKHISAAPSGPEQENVWWQVHIAEKAFVLWKPLSILRGEVIAGRATRIWRAWLLEDMSKPAKERRNFIVKDSWRYERRTQEGEFYDRLQSCDGVAKCVAYATPKIDGADDDTATTIRRGLKPSGAPVQWDNTLQVPYSHTTRGSSEHYLEPAFVDSLPPHQLEHNPTVSCRKHSLVALETYGWPVKYASSRLELVQVMRDAIAGHKNATGRNILHRDISVGNVLINEKKEANNRGVLIDFENAKDIDPGKNHKTIHEDPLSFTFPYASSELLTGDRYFPDFKDDFGEKPKHDTVHDLESFLWVLCWVCICRVGPAKRRPALYIGNDPEGTHAALRKYAKELFECHSKQEFGLQKHKTFTSPARFEHTVLGIFSPYWSPLRGLARKLYDILLKAYNDRRYDSLYPDFLEAFNAAEASLLNDIEHRRVPKTRGAVKYRKRELMRRKLDSQILAWQPSPRTRRAETRGTEENEAAGGHTHVGSSMGHTSQTRVNSASPTPAKKRAKTGHMRDDTAPFVSSSTAVERSWSRGQSSMPPPGPAHAKRGRGSSRNASSTRGTPVSKRRGHGGKDKQRRRADRGNDEHGG